MAPNVMVYTSLMTGCVATKDADEAFKIFEAILKGTYKQYLRFTQRSAKADLVSEEEIRYIRLY
jgi:pentatricopeptide repeat protein